MLLFLKEIKHVLVILKLRIWKLFALILDQEMLLPFKHMFV